MMFAKESVERFFVITGGPGSGKTSLIEALAKRGYARTEEAGRGIIRDQVEIGGRALPWDDRVLFSELMLSWEMRSYQMAQNCNGLVFFDRGVPDVLGYLRLIGHEIPEHMKSAAKSFRYHRRVFIAPPWDEIFKTDSERKQDFAEAIRTYHALAETYTAYDYELIELPLVSVEDRIRCVLHTIEVS